MHTPQYLYVSFLRHRSGFGHAMRAFACAHQCINLGHSLDIVFTSCEENTDLRNTHEYNALLYMHSDILNHPNVRVVSHPLQHYDAIFLDLQNLDYERFCFYQKYGFCIGIDLGGPARKCVPYLIDTIPNTLSDPNIYDPAGFVDTMMLRRKTPPRHCKHILLYAIHSTYEQYHVIIQACVTHNIHCTVVTNLPSKNEEEKPGRDAEQYVHFVPFSRNFAHTLHQYDLVITHFGLTAFEAHYANVPTVLVNPSAYHTHLSKRAGFLHYYRSYRSAAKLLSRFSLDENLFHAAVNAITDMNKINQGLSVYDRLFTCADKIKSWYGQRGISNPFDLENNRMPIALFRDEEKSVFMCRTTKLMFQIPFSDPVTYDDAYFFSEYKAQYGRTYLEDFEAICKKADERLHCIERIISHKQDIKKHDEPLRLIDLGCAYGAMLTRTKARGFISCGVDISEDACAYVTNTLKIPALCASIFHNDFDASHAAFSKKHSSYFQIPEAEGTNLHYDVLSCWYVLEHAPHFDSTVDIIKRLLKPRGIFALAVPNGRGISARRYRTSFLRANPIDHFSIFSPKMLVKILHAHGFVIRALRITGNHPSRFLPSALQWVLYPPVQSLVCALSKLFHLGDTFELYLEKRNET